MHQTSPFRSAVHPREGRPHHGVHQVGYGADSSVKSAQIVLTFTCHSRLYVHGYLSKGDIR